MKNKKKLKGKEVFIEDDLTKQEEEIQKRLRLIAKAEKEKGNNVKIGFQKLNINGIWTRIEELKENE